MGDFICFGKKLLHAFKRSWSITLNYIIHQSKPGLLSSLHRVLLFRVNLFWIHLLYFIVLSLMGYLSLRVSEFKTSRNKPKDLDVLFMSVSAATVSSMDTVEMEVFSDTQNVILTLLMLLGGEIFTSLLELQFARSKLYKRTHTSTELDSYESFSKSSNIANQIELGLVNLPLENKTSDDANIGMQRSENNLKYRSMKCLVYVVLAYLVVVHFCGSCFVYIYLTVVSSASEILKHKSLNALIFSVFLTVSTFANCGFVPTNENMMVFRNNSGLLLLLIPQILTGNTLYPAFLRLIIWILHKLTKREEFDYMLRNCREMDYTHLISGMQSWFLVTTVLGFVLIQFVLFCTMEWSSESLAGLNSYHKFVASLFQVSNTRYSGESVIDLSLISPAILVLFVIMMYFPPYTSFKPIKDDEEEVALAPQKGVKRMSRFLEHLMFSHLSYLVVFIILICITEREKLTKDPLNFTVLNIVLEVVSAYGNVGFTASYSCKRRLDSTQACQDKWYGFSGHWSSKGKLILIVVMIFGRLKKFGRDGGRAWKLS